METLFIYFSDISTSDLCRHQALMPVFFSSSGKVVLKRILHSGQWKRIFWLVETILFQYLKYNFHWKQFFLFLGNNFKRILYQSQSQRIFCLVETIFRYFSQKISCPLAIMSSFSQNCFLLIPIMVSTSSEIALAKKIQFPRILKNTFPPYGKTAFTLKISEKLEIIGVQ